VLNNSLFNCLTLERCIEECSKQSFEYNYSFVWFFIIAYFISTLKYFVFRFKFIPNNKIQFVLKYIDISSYVLNLSGILIYLLLIR